MDQSNLPDSGRISGGSIRKIIGPVPTEPLPSRITVVEHVTYNTRTNPSHVTVTKFGRDQTTDEQPFERRVTLTTSWGRMDHGWVGTCGMLVVRNDEGRFLQRVLSADQREELASRVVELYLSPDGSAPPEGANVVLVPPGESCRLTPSDVSRVWIRCASGTAKTVITVLPG